MNDRTMTPRVALCTGDCGLCTACVRRLPVALVELMAKSRDAVPVVFETAVRCAGMWLRANPQPDDNYGCSPNSSSDIRTQRAEPSRPGLWQVAS